MLCRGKLPESIGDKLPTGEMDSNFLGKSWLDSPGEILNYMGEVTPLNV